MFSYHVFHSSEYERLPPRIFLRVRRQPLLVLGGAVLAGLAVPDQVDLVVITGN